MEYIMLLDYGYRRSAMNFQHAENENKTSGGVICIDFWIYALFFGEKLRFLVFLASICNLSSSSSFPGAGF